MSLSASLRIDDDDPFDKLFVGPTPAMRAVLRTARLVAATDATVLLTGETGTGKEVMAVAIHQASRRAARPFVTINCAALPEALVESELFGSRRGAFTGAVADQPGKLPAADGGSVFLDEIGEMPLPAQAKLLRFLETGEVQPVGQVGTRCVDARVIAATNRDLAALVAEGRFREDLYYRLNVVPLELPPLRARCGDVLPLLQFFLGAAAARHGVAAPRLEPDAAEALCRHRWPGNVRELRNLCERLVILHAGGRVRAADLPRDVTAAPAAGAGFSLPDSGIVLEELERSLIGEALRKSGGNRSHAARLLGLSRDTLLYRLKKYDLAPAAP